ncbi:MAG TPA: hypothetical protein VGC05_04840, partial [Mycobacterium sp.]
MRSPGEVGVEKEESVAALSDIRNFLRPLGTTPIRGAQPEDAIRPRLDPVAVDLTAGKRSKLR